MAVDGFVMIVRVVFALVGVWFAYLLVLDSALGFAWLAVCLWIGGFGVVILDWIALSVGVCIW